MIAQDLVYRVTPYPARSWRCPAGLVLAPGPQAGLPAGRALRLRPPV
ncbi:MAG: hypothetical protein M3Y33_06895 [Actinomycetota bacterium]|nr:hypothetical protein [Actinomycetota bacterium]